MPEERKISSVREWIQTIIAPLFPVGLWFLLMPETYWERAATTLFCAILLVLVYTFPYLQGKIKEND